MRLVTWILTRSCVLFGLAAALLYTTLDFERAVDSAKLQTLNRLMPSYSYLIDQEENGVEAGQKDLAKGVFYFKKVSEYIPQLSNPHLMLGYSYYYLGKEQEAVSALVKSAEMNPTFFWPYYNLGVVYFHQGRYQEATDAFAKALKTDPQINVKVMYSSKVYQPLIVGASLEGAKLTARLKSAYADGQRLMILSQYFMKPGISEDQKRFAISKDIAKIIKPRLY